MLRANSRPAAFCVSALIMMTLEVPTYAAPILLNGSFENVGTATASFSINNPTVLPNWAINPAPTGNHILNCLIFSGATTNLCGPSGLGFWVMPGPSPDGGNFVAIDGDQAWSSPLTQSLTGLIVGQTYAVSFYQASAQQNNRNGVTTEQWQVQLGSGPAKMSTLMNTPNHGSVGWMSQSLIFTAGAASQILSFIAVGTPNGLPPFVLLDGVSVTATPEPGTYALMGVGWLSIGLARRFLKKRS